ncbi:putative ABC transporter ATP-binding protein [Clostridium zeae]|uniref:ABC transporter ATP-binding protein n=1 Tax=Clostridium zeae TaxID=2759022 RepID=A0ABQ1E8J4_9CLOT|nr:ABC transporter ATP-binding protein [Clostridium zeae]GFZ31046.1 putative ABC transporter ATP-binding protein [Clostridium zeae]
MEAIEFQEFSFRYNNLKEYTLKNINLKLNIGEKILIAGPSGSGKSTLAHCINGLIPFMYEGEIKGKIMVDGIEPHRSSLHDVSRYVGTILQDQDGQFVGISVGEDVAFFYENHNIPKEEMVEGVRKVLTEVGMLDYINETPQNLSGGQKQKISMAGILTSDCEILLFDEPLANLDPASSKKAMKKIADINNRTKKTVIVIEHRIEDVLEQNFDRVILIDNGEIRYDGTPDELLALDLLKKYGIREPLYIEAIKKCDVNITVEDKISYIANTIKFKEALIRNFEEYNMQQEQRQNRELLTIENINFKYFKEQHNILENVSFSINKGELVAILGNNGAGKSTLMKILTGIENQKKGSVKYLGKPIDKWSIKKRADIIGYVMQNPNHMITQNMIFDEVAFALRNRKYDEKSVEEKVLKVLKLCGLYKYRNWPVASLSYGQKKRVTIASILAVEPEIIILDEPTAGQDYRTYKEFMGFIEEVKSAGVTIIMITHDMNLSLEYSDRAIVLSEGKVIGDGSLFSLISDEVLVNKADLQQPSLYKMAEIFDIKEKGAFVAHFIKKMREGFVYE